MVDMTNASEIRRVIRKLEDLFKWSLEAKRQYKREVISAQ
jgi:hypothetical protein